MLNYTKDELWSLYQQIPKELQRATFSEEIGQNIQAICKNHSIADENLVLSITKSIGYVFLGLLSPNKYSEMLQRDLSMTPEKAEKLTADLTAIIFAPLKNNLEPLYQIKIIIPKATTLVKTTDNQIKKKDTYREPIN